MDKQSTGRCARALWYDTDSSQVASQCIGPPTHPHHPITWQLLHSYTRLVPIYRDPPSPSDPLTKPRPTAPPPWRCSRPIQGHGAGPVWSWVSIYLKVYHSRHKQTNTEVIKVVARIGLIVCVSLLQSLPVPSSGNNHSFGKPHNISATCISISDFIHRSNEGFHELR